MTAAPLVVRLNAETFPVTEDERGLLASAGCVIREIEGAEDEEIVAAASDADAVMIVSAYLRAPVIERLAKCRVIARMGTGVDKIDVAQATRQGIFVTNLPEFCTAEVADHTLALLLACARQIPRFSAQMHAGTRVFETTPIHRLSAQTLGLVGFGRIGQAVALRARGFGPRVLASDPYLTPEHAATNGVTACDLDTVLAEADYLCLLCPLLPETRGMLSLREFRRMKPGAFLINTGRGELVVEDDLVTALREGLLAGAALDVFAGINVFAPDGFPTDHPLLHLDNVLVTPHLAAYSHEAFAAAHHDSAVAVLDVLAGRWPQHPVNPEVVPWFAIARSRSANAV